MGAEVHDARLVATMIVHGVDRILTVSTGDFARFPVSAVHPTSILASPPAR
ncbi:hypothetical protein [Labrys wisconsinensis]|uniref:Nucleic acid-binding protein n=1 Tax=Labrys wisconsinensis TaxID=425677 RepID=A0ABU0JC84_9HYPH|nr:hypothetical protein [Labrys wisconsinensis]MDQ0471891.1 putative nucleic acid-binding protein [Labrys wisconsinensis]